MFALNLLGVEFADRVSGGGEMAVVDSGGIRVEVLQAKGREQLLQRQKDLVRAGPERVGQD